MFDIWLQTSDYLSVCESMSDCCLTQLFRHIMARRS